MARSRAGSSPMGQCSRMLRRAGGIASASWSQRCSGGARGQVDGVAPIQIQVGGQRHQRRMRMGVGDMPQGRPARIAPLDHPGGLAGGPVGDVQAFRQVPGAVQIVVVVHAVQVLLARRALFGQVHVVVVHRAQLRAAFLGQQDVVEADAVALRVQVHLAHRVGLVAAVAKALGQRGQRGHGQRGSEIAVAVAARRVPVITLRRAGMQIGHSA